MQPQHATPTRRRRRAWGARCALAYPGARCSRPGVALAFGSDAPVEPPRARLGLAAAVARLRADGRAFEPGQRLTLDEALLGTPVGARARGRRASERPARAWGPADLVVWDRDLHAAGSAEFGAGPAAAHGTGGRNRV
jgi:predicted amidohydrolase YtcJ